MTFQKGESGNPGGRSKTGQNISDHIRDLLKRDAVTVKEIVEYLGGKSKLGRVTAARLIAATMILNAMGRSEFAKEVLDRTEGKVPDKLITMDVNDMVKQLEAARQRVLSGHQSQIPGSVDGQIAVAPEAKALPPSADAAPISFENSAETHQRG